MRYIVFSICFLVIIEASGQSKSANLEMEEMLSEVYKKNNVPQNPFASQARRDHFTQQLQSAVEIQDSIKWQFLLIPTLLEYGDEKEAIIVGEHLLSQVRAFGTAPQQVVKRLLALAYLRDGEKINCVQDHNSSSCIFPISGRGIQTFKEGSAKAAQLYEEILRVNPTDVESRWLLNIAYMAIGQYPQSVPSEFLIRDLDKDGPDKVKPFEDIAMQTNFYINNLSGGNIIDDFNNDGHLDVMTSSISLLEPMVYNKNNGDGTFTDESARSGLGKFTGGLNMVQTDYNNDGYKDVFVTRGAWLANFGEQPNSLLKNNGDGTFTDVTREAGLLTFRPTQTATWADFNNDGWLDLYIGNESVTGANAYPCELYVNNKNGTFTEIAKEAGCDITLYVKGVVSGDFDKDDRMDLFLSTLDGKKVLLKNVSETNGPIRFKDVSVSAGMQKDSARTFTTWFWDFDNDGWLDIMASGYEFSKSLAWHAAEDALGMPRSNAGQIYVYRNRGDGTFENVSEKLGFRHVVFSMGGNFGDIDNDGYPDIFMGTGNPLYQSLVPNKMFHNLRGRAFADVTTSARVGNLQKGHAVAFADLDNDGDQDIYIDMGGAFDGDGYHAELFLNPGQSDYHWIKMSLEGTKANRPAIGAKIKVTFEENGKTRFVYRELNSGGSFGCNPLIQHIGIGEATNIKKIEIKWPGSKLIQTFENVAADQNIYIKEGSAAIKTRSFKKVNLSSPAKRSDMHMHHGMR